MGYILFHFVFHEIFAFTSAKFLFQICINLRQANSLIILFRIFCGRYKIVKNMKENYFVDR